MSAYELHANGDCWPERCPMCIAEADEEFVCCMCGRIADVEERHGGRDTDPGYWCDDSATDPGTLAAERATSAASSTSPT